MTSDTFGLVPGDWMQSVSEVITVRRRTEGPFTLGEAVAEIGTWAKDARAEAWAHDGNQKSLDGDIAALLDLLGPKTRSIVDDLVPNLSTASDRSVVMQAAATFLARWARPTTVGSAFRDLCEAAAAGATTERLGELAQVIASQLNAAARGFGVLSEVKSLLSANPPQWQLDEVREQDQLFVDDSPVSRLAAAARLLSADPPVGAVVVWSLYRRARISWRTPAGPVTFLDSNAAISYALNIVDHDFPEREELRSVLQHPFGLDADEIQEGENQGERYVLVRVDLGTRSPLGAAEEAERRVDALLNIAAGAGGVSWVHTGTTVTLLDAVPRSATYGRYGERSEPFRDDYGIGASGELVEKWSKQLEAAMTKGPMPDALLEALSAVKEARLTDHRDVQFYDTRPVTPRVATALEDHALEQVSSLAQMKPEKLMNELMFHEGQRRWDQRVLNALTAPLNHRDDAIETQRKREALQHDIAPYSPHGVRMVSLNRTWAARDELRDLATAPAERESVDAALLSISDRAVERAGQAKQAARTQLLRNRHRRVRNAVAHGNPVSPAALESVRSYSDHVTSDALSLALESYAASRPIGDVLDDRRAARAKDDADPRSILGRLPK